MMDNDLSASGNSSSSETAPDNNPAQPALGASSASKAALSESLRASIRAAAANATAEPPATVAAPARQRNSGGLFKLATYVVLAAAFGAAGYFAPKPQTASSAAVGAREQLGQLQSQLQMVQAENRKAQSEVRTLRDEAEVWQNFTAQADEVAADRQERLDAAKTFTADLTAKLDQANTANEPMRKKMESAMQQAQQTQESLTAASARADALVQDLSHVAHERDMLTAARQDLFAQKTRLEDSLTQRETAAAQTRRLLEVLTWQAQPTPAVSSALAEMPITEAELIHSLGQPGLVVAKNRQVAMSWGKEHSAVVEDGMVTQLDGRPPVRSALGAAAVAAAPPAPWRFKQGQPMAYADLVDLFGPAESVSGKASDFTAAWTVGAWGRKAVARVVDGVVKDIDGQPVNAAACCELARHRASAYQGDAKAAQAVVEQAKRCQAEAAAAVGNRLQDEANTRAIDGVSLKSWKLADVDSVAAWVGPSRVAPGAMTFRGRLDCTWVRLDGKVENQRRFVVVTMAKPDNQPAVAQLAVFASRD